jgi:hypothetical protein
VPVHQSDGAVDSYVTLRPLPALGPDVAIRVGRRPLLVGRGRGCDVVVLDPHVSRHHALVWLQAGQVMVRDLGSALGTRIGRRRLEAGEVRELGRGEGLHLAGRISLAWSEAPALGTTRWLPDVVLQAEGRGWTLTSAERSPFDVSHPGVGDEDLDGDTTLHSITVEWEGSEREIGRYTLTVAVEHGAPAEARFEDLAGGALLVGGESRVVLLFLLARARLMYDSGGAESPWLDDQALGIGLWGSRATELPASRLNTLVTRVRNQLEGAGFPRDLVDKRPGETRLGPAVARVALQGWSKDSMRAVP